MNKAYLLFAAGFLSAVAVMAGYQYLTARDGNQYQALADRAYGKPEAVGDIFAFSAMPPEAGASGSGQPGDGMSGGGQPGSGAFGSRQPGNGAPGSEQPEMAEIPIDFSVLEQENPDIYAWIQIPGTEVDYPVLQHAADDGYYLKHTAFHRRSAAGSIYTERANARDFSDYNTVLYGHNMADGSMFGGLKKYLDADYMKAHRDITLYTRDRVLRYRVFAAVTYDNRHLLESFQFDDRLQYQAFMDSLEDRRSLFSYLDASVPVTAEDRIITLSTCNGNDNQRLLVVAVLIPEEQQWSEYQYNPYLWNILIAGIDKSERVSIQELPGYAGQADFIMVLSLDRRKRTGRLLQIPRSLMTDVELYDAAGQYFTTVTAPVATQYAYGSGEKSSSLAMTACVSRILYGIPVDDYLSVNIAGLPALNDEVGGVTLEFSRDYTGIDEAFEEGQRICLDGEQAERFVRYRDTTVTGSSLERMERQRQYLPALFRSIQKYLRREDGSVQKLLERMAPYTVTDMKLSQFESLTEYQVDFEQIQVVPGAVTAGEEYDEFYADEEGFRQLLLHMFYEKEGNQP
ncbi:MAG: class B sortase [Eubacteriales bacterium]|nr:class B sortase [Eubacteriales bacterium]